MNPFDFNVFNLKLKLFIYLNYVVKFEMFLREELVLVILSDLQHFQEVTDGHVNVPDRQVAYVVDRCPQLIHAPVNDVLVFLFLLQKYLEQVL